MNHAVTVALVWGQGRGADISLVLTLALAYLLAMKRCETSSCLGEGCHNAATIRQILVNIGQGQANWEVSHARMCQLGDDPCTHVPIGR